MSRTLAELEAAALNLSVEERRLLIETISVSLDDEGLSDDWRAEVARRVAEIEAGEAALIPAEIALAEIRQELAAERRSRS